MPVVIQDFEAVQEGGGTGASSGGSARPGPAPVAHAALDRMFAAHRTRLLRRWAN